MVAVLSPPPLLLLNNITKDYMKTTPQTVTDINNEAKTIATSLELANRIEEYGDGTAFITLKDHKENFLNDPKFRLINPAKSQMGKISKQLLQKINEEVRESTGLKQWRSTADVIDWFNGIKDKSKKRFLQMDICEFYPSITEELLDKALRFASTKTKEPISAETIHIIKHARKSLLFSHSTSNKEKTPWTKRQGLFDVTMGAPDGAEVCELVGLFLLNEVKEKFPELDFGLYRDDGLAAHRRIPGPRMDRIKKDLIALFRKHGLKITFEPPNQTISTYLDVTFDLAKETIAPYRKPNDTPLYVHKDSNHPPNVIDGILKSINKRLSSISS